MNRIKVVHLVYSFELGGIESLLVDLLSGLDKDKFDVHLIVLTSDKTRMVEYLKSVTVHLLDYKTTNIKKIKNLYPSLISLAGLLKEINPAIIHSHLAATSFLFIAIALKISKAKVKHIRTVHTTGMLFNEKKTYKEKLMLLQDKIAMRISKPYLVSISKSVQKNNLKYFKNCMAGERLIYNGIDLNLFDSKYCTAVKNDFGIQDSASVVTYISRIDYGKNHDFLLEIWAEVIKENPQAVLCIAGDGPLKMKCIEKAEELKISKNVIFLGRITKVVELLNVTDIAVFPSSYEGFSIVMLEKLAMGLPVIASDIEPFKEIMKNNEEGYLISLTNKNRFIDKLIYLLSNKDTCKIMSEKARVTAANYSIGNTVKQHEDIYFKLLAYNTKRNQGMLNV